MTSSWNRSCSHDTTADPARIWTLLADVPGWKAWNAGIAAIAIEGAFVAGTQFSMTLPDGPVLNSRLVDVQAPWRFTDETWIDGTVVRVEHALEPLPDGGCRVRFAAQAEGPDAAAIGEAASADFAQVLQALARLAEQ